MSEYVLNFDGSVGPGNPDVNARYAYVIRKDGKNWCLDKGDLEKTQKYSNNYVEFYALYKALKMLSTHITPSDCLLIRGDSQLVIKMLKNWYKPTPTKLYYPAYLLAAEALREIRSKRVPVSIDWVPREMNTEADKASKYSK